MTHTWKLLSFPLLFLRIRGCYPDRTLATHKLCLWRATPIFSLMYIPPLAPLLGETWTISLSQGSILHPLHMTQNYPSFLSHTGTHHIHLPKGMNSLYTSFSQVATEVWFSFTVWQKSVRFRKGSFLPVFPFTISGADCPVYCTDLQQHYTILF